MYLGLLIWMTVYGLFCLLSSIVTCVPIAKYWDPSIPGGCIDRSKLHYALAGFNIANDIALLVLPMPFLKGLQIQKKSKIILYCVFACGSLWVITFRVLRKTYADGGLSACIVAIVRLYALWVNNSAPIDKQPS